MPRRRRKLVKKKSIEATSRALSDSIVDFIETHATSLEHSGSEDSDSGSDSDSDFTEDSWASALDDDSFFMPRTPQDHVVGSFLVEEKLERGGFGSVFRVVRRKGRNKTPLAMKVYSLDSDSNTEREMEILHQVAHAHILQVSKLSFFTSCANNVRYSYVTMRLYPQDLVKIIYSTSRPPLTPLEIRTIMRQLLSALECLHEHGFVHADIKPENILVDDSSGPLHACLCDFGSAFNLDDEEHDPYGHTLTFSAPEVVLNIGELLSSAVDVFALACVYVEMATQQALFLKQEDELLHLAAVQKMDGWKPFSPEMHAVKGVFTHRGALHDNARRRVSNGCRWHEGSGLLPSQIAFVESCCRIDPAERLTTQQATKWVEQFYLAAVPECPPLE